MKINKKLENQIIDRYVERIINGEISEETAEKQCIQELIATQMKDDLNREFRKFIKRDKNKINEE